MAVNLDEARDWGQRCLAYNEHDRCGKIILELCDLVEKQRSWCLDIAAGIANEEIGGLIDLVLDGTTVHDAERLQRAKRCQVDKMPETQEEWEKLRDQVGDAMRGLQSTDDAGDEFVGEYRRLFDLWEEIVAIGAKNGWLR